MRSDSLREKPKQTPRVVAAVLAVLVAVAIFIGSSIPGSLSPAHPEFLNVIGHFSEYFLLAALITVATNAPQRKLWIAALIGIAIASLYGVSDEFHQLFVPGRTSDQMDWVTDTVGALFGAATAVWVISARIVNRSRRRDG